MATIQEITKKLEHLSSEKLLVVFKFIDFLEQNEMSEDEVILAAEKAGTFDYLKDPKNDIYTLDDGEPL